MKKKAIFTVVTVIILGLIAWGGIFVWNNFRGVGPAIESPPKDVAEEIKNKPENATDFPLEVNENFSISIFAEDLPDVRVLVRDGLGNFWASQPDKGTVSLLTTENGEVTNKEVIFNNLNRPHGLAIDPENPTTLYIAETDAVSRVDLYSEGSPQKIADLPGGGRHFTRTLGFGPDGKLYVSIGSSCDTCEEDDERRAAIYSINKDGSDFRKFADGLRNAVFFNWHPNTDELWATEMGRDHLGDDLPPDEINIVKEGEFYGWPYCYGDNVQDTRFSASQEAEEICENAEPSHIDLQAHVAPLGLDFVPDTESWPEGMRGDLLVAYHGSWNRSVPVGYKIARIELSESGELESNVEEDTGFVQEKDFISGWLTDEGALGRPVDVLAEEDGMLYITDDKAGVIYKVTAK